MDTFEKARKLVSEGRIEKEIATDKRIHFKVLGETEEHSVVFNRQKNTWSCDCRYSSLQKKECSHIIAAKMKI